MGEIITELFSVIKDLFDSEIRHRTMAPSLQRFWDIIDIAAENRMDRIPPEPRGACKKPLYIMPEYRNDEKYSIMELIEAWVIMTGRQEQFRYQIKDKPIEITVAPWVPYRDECGRLIF